MNYFRPKRWDIIEESNRHFFMNLFWGMWVNNEWRRAQLACGNCGMRCVVSYRDKNPLAKCRICGKMNKLQTKW